jgi:hypothetical protein
MQCYLGWVFVAVNVLNVCVGVELAFTSRSMEIRETLPAALRVKLLLLMHLTVRRTRAVSDCFCSPRISVDVFKRYGSWTSESPVSCEIESSVAITSDHLAQRMKLPASELRNDGRVKATLSITLESPVSNVIWKLKSIGNRVVDCI